MQTLEFGKRMSLINEMTDNIMKKGIVKSKFQAEQIARRWIKY